jgi:hypothetical protein
MAMRDSKAAKFPKGVIAFVALSGSPQMDDYDLYFCH